MAIAKKTVTVCTCERCSHTWQPRDPKTPTICPKCKSVLWNEKEKPPKAGRRAR